MAPKRHSGNTQVDRVLRMLQTAPAVCSTDLIKAYMPRAADAIYKLRKAGYRIHNEPCNRPGHHHQTHQIQYVLEASPGRLFD